MRSSRAVVLMGILLLLLVGYLSRGMWINYVPLLAGPDGPRPSSNSVTNLRVALEADGQWHARFDYGYTGEPEYAMFRIVEVHGLQREGGPESSMPTMRPAVIGSHSIDQIISRPQGDDPQFTHSVDAALVKNGTSVTAAKVNVTIEWPSSTEATFLSFTKGRTPGQIVDMAADLIDTGGRRNIERANEFLDRVVEKNPQVDTAYIELARVRMKLNWGSEGLAQAEKVLDTAMKIKPGDNARILLGYV